MSETVKPVVRRFTGGAFGQNSYLVSCPGTNEGILVDPGASVGQMLAAAETEGIRIVGIVLTHAHIDHVEGVPEAKRATGAPVYLHPADSPLYVGGADQARLFGLPLDPLPAIDEFLQEFTPVRFGECELEVRHTPGHSPGHVILVGPGVALVGDCVFMGSIGRTDLPGGDFQTLMRSIRTRILDLPDDTVLYSGHGPETTIRHERVSNPFLVPHLGGSNFA